MKLTKLHKKILKIAIENRHADIPIYDLMSEIKRKTNSNKVEYEIGKLFESNYLKLMATYEMDGNVVHTIICNRKNYKIKCELKLKN